MQSTAQDVWAELSYQPREGSEEQDTMIWFWPF